MPGSSAIRCSSAPRARPAAVPALRASLAWLARTWVPVIAVLLSATSACAALPETVARIRPSVVAVGTVMPDKRVSGAGPSVKYMGTGFVVGNGRQVITNRHVVPEKLDADAGESLAVFTGRGEKGLVRQARLLRTDDEHDLALLEMGGEPLPALVLASSEHLPEGADVAFTGFPIGMVLGLYPATHRGIVAAITPIVIPALSSRTLTAEQIKRIRSPFDVYQLDATAYPGNSGSPVYDVRTGEVVGVINSVLVKKTKEAALSDPSGISYAIPVSYVRELLAGKR